jgi:predicted metal-dependent hydrolase
MIVERILVAGDRSISYSVIRSDRRTIAVSVSRNGAVCVRVPRWLPEREVTRFLSARTGWIVRKHVEAAERVAASPGPLTPEELARARAIFPERMAACWAVFARPGEVMPGLRVRVMRTRWGSLAPSGRVTLNAALVRAPAVCLDYVIFHELCHLRVRGHSRDFWEELARYVPDWKARRSELRDHIV